MRNENCSTFKKQVVSCSFTQWYWLLDLTWKQLEFPNASIRSKAFEHLQQNIGTFRPACVIIIIIGVLINVITHNFSVENRLVNITQIQNITPDLNLNIDLFCLPAVWNCGSFRLNQKLLDNFKLIDCVQRDRRESNEAVLPIYSLRTVCRNIRFTFFYRICLQL